MSIWDEYYDEPPQAQNPPPPRFTPPQDDIIDRLVAMGKPQADTPLPAPNYFTPSVAPYASRGSQTRMDELPPRIAPTPSPTPTEANPLLNALHGEFTPQVGAPPLSPTAISDVHEKNKGELVTQIPVLGGALSALNTTLRRAGEGFAGAWGKTGGEEVGSIPFDKAFANVPLTGAGILTAESVFPQTKAALSTPVRDVPGLGLAMRLGEGLGGALMASSEVLAQPLAGAMTATDQQGLDKSAFAGKETPEEAKELYRGMLLGTNTPEQNRRAEELARQSYGVLEKQQPIVAAIGTTMFDPLTWVDVGGVIPKLSEVQGLRRAWAAGGDVSKAGEMVGKNVNPLEEIIFKAFQPKSVKEGEWIGKEALGIVTPKDSEAFRRAWNLFRKDPTAKVIESVERVMGNLSPFIADLNRPVEDSVKFLKLAKEALRQEKMTPELMGALKQFGLHDAQDFRRALHGLSEFDPTAMLEARAEAHKIAQSIRQTTQTARPGLYNADVAQFARGSAKNLGGGYEKLFNRVLDGWKEGKLDIDELERGIESVAKYQMLADLTDQVGASFAKTAQIPKPNVITNVVNTMKQHEGALYVGWNPASLVQNVVGDISRGLWHGASFKSQKQLDALFARYGFPYVDELGAKTRGAIAGVNGAKVGAADDISAFGASVPKWFNKVPVIKQMNEAFGKSQMLGRQIARATGMERFMARNFVPPEMPPALVQFYGKEAKKVARQLAGARNYKEAYEIMARGMPTFDKYIDEMAGELTRIFSDVKGQPFEVTADMLRDAMPLALRENFNRVMSETWEAVGRGEDAKAAYQAARRRVYAEDLKGDTFDDLFPQPQAKPQAKTAPVTEPPIEQAAPNVPPEPIAAAPIEPAPRVEPLPEANVADETMQTAPVPENAPAVTPLDENPLAPANLPEVQLTEGQQSARDYLLSLKNAEGAPQYTAEQLATWKPETMERFAGELSSFDDIVRTFAAKTGKDATKSGDYLKNLLNAEISRKGFKDPQIENIAPFRDMADIQARADEAYRLLRGYDTYPTLQEGEFKWQLRVKMLEDEMPQELQDGVETIYDALANSAAKRAGMDVDTWWTKRAAGIEGAPATGNVRGLQQDSTKVTNKAIEYFGLTNDPREAGYILDDGRMLNLSGEKQGGGASVRGSRNLDHRDINMAFDRESGREAHSGMLEFMDMGNVRWSQIGNTVYIDVTRTPSPEQMRQILRHATGKEVVFDLTNGKTGVHIFTKEFGKAKRQGLIELFGEVEEELSKRGLFQRSTASETKGATDFLRDGRALLRFFKGKADASTYVHEAAHLFMPTLDASDMDELAKWTGLNNGDELRLLHERWARGDATLGKLPGGKRAELQFREMGKATSDAERYAIAQEKFARGFEKYLSEGVAPTEGLQRVFDQFKDFLMEIYRGVTGSEIDVKLTDEMRALYGRMLDADQVISPQELKRIQEEAIRAARGEMAEQGLGVGAHAEDMTPNAVVPPAPMPAQTDTGQFTLFQEGENNARLEEAIRKMREGGQETVADGALNAEALDALERVLLDRLYPAFSEDAMKARGVLSPEIEKEMNRYLAQAYMPELTQNMQAANAMGRFFQDATVLNYDGKWNIETAMLLERPFVHWMLHSALNYARDFIDHPAALAFLLRTTNAMHAESDKLIERGELPERFRDKMKVSFPFSIPGIGDSLWINPLRSVMPYEDIFQLNAVDRAGFQSVKEDGTTDPTNIVNDLFGIHTPIKLAVNALTQDDAEFQNTIASIPAARLLRGITSGIVPGGVDLGLKGKYDDAYLMRALKELVADGTLTPERAKVALLQQSGGDWDLVKQRAGLENYGARELSALFGARGMVYTPGEQKYLDTKKQDAAFLSDAVRKLGGNPNMDRTQQHEFLKAKGFYATDEYQQWRAAHPELEMGGFLNQYDDAGNPLAEDKAQEARARDYYLDKIGEAYWNAPELKQKLIAADLGAPFQKLFRNKDTRDLDAIPTQTILGWANALDMLLPEPVAGTNLPNPEASHVTFTTDEQNARYQSFYDEVENAYGWQQYGAKWDEYYELKKNDPQAAKAFWKTPDGMKLNAVRERVDEFFKENPDLEKVLMQAGLREPRAAADASPSNPQGAAWAQALTAVGYASREEYDAESAAYKALPKGSQDRRDYLLTHPRLLRMYQIGDSLYDDKPTSSRAGGRSTSSKSGKSNPYVPFYLRPSYQPRVTEPRAYHSGGITRGNYVSTKNLYLLFAGLKRRRGGSGGTARRASTAYRNG